MANRSMPIGRPGLANPAQVFTHRAERWYGVGYSRDLSPFIGWLSQLPVAATFSLPNGVCMLCIYVSKSIRKKEWNRCLKTFWQEILQYVNVIG
jgi:hypothetical protein